MPTEPVVETPADPPIAPTLADPPADPPAITDPPKDPEPHFTTLLGGELSNHPGLTKFANPTELGKSYLELETRLSAQGIRVPTDEASEDEIKEYREAIGVPKDASGYNFETSITVPEGLPVSSEMVTGMTKVMHDLGMSPAQFQGVTNEFLKMQAAEHGVTQANAVEVKEKAETLLKTKWGSSYDAHIRGANLAMDELFGDDMKSMAMTALADGTMLGAHPGFIMAMAKVGEAYAEHDVNGMGSRRRITMTPEEAGSEITKLQGDEKFQKSLNNKHDPGHAAAVERQNSLYAMKAAGGA